jgi:hypothetical protein
MAGSARGSRVEADRRQPGTRKRSAARLAHLHPHLGPARRPRWGAMGARCRAAGDDAAAPDRRCTGVTARPGGGRRGRPRAGLPSPNDGVDVDQRDHWQCRFRPYNRERDPQCRRSRPTPHRPRNRVAVDAARDRSDLIVIEGSHTRVWQAGQLLAGVDPFPQRPPPMWETFAVAGRSHATGGLAAARPAAPHRHCRAPRTQLVNRKDAPMRLQRSQRRVHNGTAAGGRESRDEQ